ncbi:hypothetical protein Acr_01g0002690 [Actinidia rufa]|uniref:Uncharacterized protein n=1 Tax=Actinidia rufa TaxID=165716 RepID=A0A7J0E240_9ERIC|nr:hypothetical protein Acr_01g0002690 [Actinidia rufa]
MCGRTVGYALLLFGNIGLYYYSEKSIACMLTFLFLGFYCLCTLFYIQPFTDFGVLDFFLSASLTQALSLFGLHIYSWLVFIVVIVLAGLRYQLELVLLKQSPREVESGRMANADSGGEARDRIEVLQPRREVELEHLLKKFGSDSELARDIGVEITYPKLRRTNSYINLHCLITQPSFINYKLKSVKPGQGLI